MSARVRQYMTQVRHLVSPSQTLRAARLWMDTLKLHYLPVVDEGQVRGLLTVRDLALAESSNADLDHERVAEWMCPAFVTDSDASMGAVAREMGLRGLIGAVVLQDGKVSGALTAEDAFWAIAALCA